VHSNKLKKLKFVSLLLLLLLLTNQTSNNYYYYTVSQKKGPTLKQYSSK